MNTDGQEHDFARTLDEPPARLDSNCFGFTNGAGAAGASKIKPTRPRGEYRWSKAARDLVRANAEVSGADLSSLVTQLVEQSGYPRRACWKFVRRMGIRSRRPQKRWTQAERKRLEKLIDLHPVKEIATMMHRSQSSVWHMLYRMGASATMGRDSFTKNSLAVALHVSPIQIESWIKRGWLKAREVQTGRIKRVIIAAEDFCHFCRTHTKDAAGNRLIQARFDFVYQFAFSPSHAELLPVRESKKERSAFATQLKKEASASESRGSGGEAAEEDDPLDRIA